jgi:hypothetical protein
VIQADEEIRNWARRELNRFGVEDQTIEMMGSILLGDDGLPANGPSGRENFQTIVLWLLHSLHHGQRNQILLGLCESAQGSRFSAREWLEAIASFARTLSERGEVARLDLMNEYLECVAASPEAKSGSYDLGALLQLHLTEFGFAAARSRV